MVDEKLLELKELIMKNSHTINVYRSKSLINAAIEKFHLDLSGLVVLTEAATNYYMLTPMIAALANADKVYAITRDSRYGKAKDVHAATLDLAQIWGINSKIEIILSRDDQRIVDADIVTNLGFVRPLDKTFLISLKSTVAIPLMWAAWEYRKEDLDLEEARRLGIPVLGTNELDHRLQTTKYVGITALKLLLNMDIEVFCSNIVIMGSNDFAQPIREVISNVGGISHCLEVTSKGEYDVKSFWESIDSADALVICDHRSKKRLFGIEKRPSAKDIYRRNPGLVVIHICGNVETNEIASAGLKYSSSSFAAPGFMTVTTDYVGPKPLIDLHTAGLHIGELLAKKRRQGLNRMETEEAVLQETTLAQGFSCVTSQY